MREFAIGNLKFAQVKSVTRPVLKIEGSKTVYFTIQGAIHKAPQTEAGRQQKDANGNVLPPPDLMDVLNLETGEEQVVVVNTVLGKNLTENYPEDSYIGKSFAVGKYAPANGKRYATFQIAEIALQESPSEESNPSPEALAEEAVQRRRNRR